MRIQHNIMAMSAYRNYTNNVAAMKKNLEKLSSGYKINRAGDDAAGLAISEKMRAQITGLETAQKNAKDGISLVQTAEGALTEVHDMLNRMVELATMSANGTYDNTTDRAQLQKEMDQLTSEINRIADSANFNGIKLLDGSMDAGETAAASGKFETLEMAAVSSKGSVDGEKPTEGAKSEITFTLDKGGKLKSNVGDKTIDSKKLSDLYDAYDEDGNKLDWTTDTAVAADDGMKVTLVAKTVGALTVADSSTFQDDIEGILDTNVSGIKATNGINVGDASSANTAAVYTLDFKDLSSIQGGDTFTLDDVTFEFTMDPTATGNKKNDADKAYVAIDIRGLDLEGGGTAGADWETLKAAIKTAVSGATGLNTTDFTYTEEGLGSNNPDDYVLTVTTKAVGMDANQYQAPKDWQNDGAFTIDFEPAKYSTSDGKGVHAKAVYDLGVKPKAGDKIMIGDKTIEIIDKYEKDDDGNLLTDKAFSEGKLTAKDFTTDNVNKVLQSLHYEAGRVEINGTKISVEKGTADDTTAAAWSQGLGKVQFAKKPAETAATAASAGPGKALTLQIGDTADSWNQLKVNIKDMHAASLGLDGLSIADQDSAAAAVDVIKAAINTVSDVRGTLGATQNRLDHTINNLSVMTENIQDAESTIRDVDVAEEMMAYTKNNILIQSAQAMLAQANQVPQGVLQLLQ